MNLYGRIEASQIDLFEDNQGLGRGVVLGFIATGGGLAVAAAAARAGSLVAARTRLMGLGRR